MKNLFSKLFSALFVVLSILFVFPSGIANATNSQCDSTCIERAVNGELSSQEIKYYGVGNLVRLVTDYFEGDVWKGLKSLGLASNTYTADTTVNAVFDTQLDGSVIGMYLCQENFAYCEEGQILGYIQKDDIIFRITCTPGKDCEESFLLDEMPNDSLIRIFN